MSIEQIERRNALDTKILCAKIELLANRVAMAGGLNLRFRTDHVFTEFEDGEPRVELFLVPYITSNDGKIMDVIPTKNIVTGEFADKMRSEAEKLGFNTLAGDSLMQNTLSHTRILMLVKIGENGEWYNMMEKDYKVKDALRD